MQRSRRTVRDTHAIARLTICGSVHGREDKAKRPGIEVKYNTERYGTLVSVTVLQYNPQYCMN